MCLLVKVAPNTVFPDGWFEDCFKRNRDGIGLSYGDGKRVVVFKYLPKSAADAQEWLRVHAPRDREYALHWRMRTHGAVDLDRVHPYRVTDNVWVMHNGILRIDGDTSVKSDTQLFAEAYDEAIPALLGVRHGLSILGAMIGTNNRMIFIHADGRLQVANEHTGMTVSKIPGCWFSNQYAWTPSMWDDFVYKPTHHYFTPPSRHVKGGHRGVNTERYPVNKSAKESADVFSRATAEVVQEHAVGKPDPAAAPASGGVAGDILTPIQRDILSTGAEIFKLAAEHRLAGDAAAGRFLAVFDDVADFVIAVHAVFSGGTDPEDAEDVLFDTLSTTHQYLEAGVSTFDDVLRELSNADKVNIG